MARDSGSIPLVFGPDQYARLVVSGLVGGIPVTVWMVVIAGALGLLESKGGAPQPNPIVVGIFVTIVMVAMLGGPWLIPCLVLRARQPRGARIEWNEREIIEWDGPWRRAHIAWDDLIVRQSTWKSGARSRSEWFALQLSSKSRPNAPVITAWNTAPDNAPKIRRRLIAVSLIDLRKAIEAHDIALADAGKEIDWPAVVDPDRSVDRRATILGRFGYPCAVIAPLLVPGSGTNDRSPASAIIFALLGTALLGYRAVPVLREVRAIRARLAGGASAVTEDAAGRENADRSKLRAALAESVVRVGCAALVILTTALAFRAFR